MKILSLATIRKKTTDIARIINAPRDLLPTFGSTRDFGNPHIEVDKKNYHYVIVERGIEWERSTTQNLNELLYWIFNDVTFQMACDYEVKNRVNNQDFRRELFRKQLEFMKNINSDFSKKLEEEIREILKNHPFNDNR